MDYKIYPSPFKDYIVDLPASKSISNRLLIIQSLSHKAGKLTNIAVCDDTDARNQALQDYQTGNSHFNIGAAGTAMRFLTSYFALISDREITLDGTARMRQRPIRELVEVLRQCGAEIKYISLGEETNDSCPPIAITGKRLTGGVLQVRGNISSQYISSLMMVAPYMQSGLTIEIVGGLVSRPYVEMTAGLMREFGASVEIDDNKIAIRQGEYNVVTANIESDWSAASYWYELKALLPNTAITLKGLCENSVQGDSRLIEYFRDFGVETHFTSDGAILRYNSELEKATVDIDLTEQPDIAQTIAVTACLLGKPFCLRGLSTLKIKETDRIHALITQLAKLGYVVKEGESVSLIWDGTKTAVAESPQIETFKDHRMAMAFAPAAIKISGLTILDAGVVSKSYPDYWNHLVEFGFRIEE